MLESKLIIKPNKDIWWISMSVGPCFVRQVNKYIIEVFLTGRDKYGISRIGKSFLEIREDNTLRIIEIEEKPILDIGPPGCFDENGVSYPWIVKNNNIEYLYYVGWVNGGLNRFQNFLGLATKSSEDKFFQRKFNVPILERSEQEPYGTGSCCVIKNNKKWLMLYTSFLPWQGIIKASNIHPHSQPSYNIKIARSDNLINWERNYQNILEFKSGEFIQGKPVLFKDNDKNHELYFSVRGEAYRIGIAKGSNINQLERGENLVFKKQEWISQTQEYAFPIKLNNKKYLFFNGNGYGKTGLGYTIL